MIKKMLLSPLINLGIKFLDDTIPTEKLHHFLDNGIKNISQSAKSFPDWFTEKDLNKIERAKTLNEGWKNPSDLHEIDLHDFSLSDLEKEEVDLWIKALPKNRVISFKGLVPRTGEMMCWLFEKKAKEEQSYFDSQIETLLRLIEIKKQKGLAHNQGGFEELLASDQQYLSILFSRIAREKKDIRFLNIALKMNDWAYPAFRGINNSPDLINFLLAIAEAEYSFKELLN